MAASNVFGSMPSPPPTGNGIYDVTATSGPYSQKLRAVDRVGTAQYPFLPSCQPAYIPVLYRNFGTINDTGLEGPCREPNRAPASPIKSNTVL